MSFLGDLSRLSLAFASLDDLIIGHSVSVWPSAKAETEKKEAKIAIISRCFIDPPRKLDTYCYATEMPHLPIRK